MAEIARTALFGKLNEIAYRSFESATASCKARGNPYVEVEHWIDLSMAATGGDLSRICAHFEIDLVALRRDVDAALDRLPRGAASIIDFADTIEGALDRGWTYATLLFRRSSIRSGDVIVGLLKSPTLAKALFTVSPEFERIDVGALTDRFDDIVSGSPEDDTAARDGSGGPVQAGQRTRSIFMSYRRADSMHLVGRMFDHLEAAIGSGNVFKDVDSMPAGIPNYEEEVRAQIKSAKVMLAVIGPHWLTATADGHRRIDDKHDLVRLEIKHALEHGLTIIPLLSEGVAMPTKAQLPPPLRNFALCQAMHIRVDPDFRNDMAVLITRCRSYLAAPSTR